jgi:hypothetical protein
MERKSEVTDWRCREKEKTEDSRPKARQEMTMRGK